MAKKSKPFVIDHATDTDLLFDPVVGGERKGRGYDPSFIDPEIKREMKALPSEIKIVPRSEWSARIKERKQLKQGLRYLKQTMNNGKPHDSLDQNGQGYSHTGDTEVLTEKGWVCWPDWNHSDLLGTVNPQTHRLEFQAASEWHASEYHGEMYHSTNRRLDFGVTNYHRMYVRKWDERRRTLSDGYSFQTAQDLGWYVGMLPAPSGWVGTELVELAVPDGPRWDGDDFVAVLALVVSDGYAGGSEKGRDVVSFCCFDERYPAVAALAARTGFREQPGRKGVWNLSGGAFARWVRAKCYTGPELGATRKCVPDVVKVASMRQIGHFLNWFGDRTKQGVSPAQFYSSSKRLIDDLQELHLRVGKRSHVGTRPAKTVPFAGNADGVIRSKEAYVLTVGEVDRLCIDRKKHIEQDRYRGLVYCATVPNGLLVTRRNGSVLISGNCWFYSQTAGIMYCRAAQNLPYVRLSAHSGACVIKNFRDEGGWCGLSARFCRGEDPNHPGKSGVVPVSHWPEKSMSRSNNTAEAWAEAAKYRINEYYADVTKNVYDQNMLEEQIVSCFFANTAVILDFNEWGHSVCGIDVDEPEPNVFVLEIDNSWSKGWGDNGTGFINKRWNVDGATAVIVA